MINKSSHLSKERGLNKLENKGYYRYPFLLKPAAKDYLWGGNRLNDDFSKEIDVVPLAETWECSTHPDGLSIVGTGCYTGLTLQQVLQLHPEYIGTHPKTKCELPILIKLIDAKQNLSVQVHPTDEYAQENENGQCGKTEMWYVLDAADGAKLTYGFKHDVTREVLKRAIEKGELDKYLQKTLVKKNDIFFIEAGMVHAIGAGVLIVEIQQNSNLTYRLYDYERIDKNGEKRELHIDKALKVVFLNKSGIPRQPLRVLKYKKGCASELLCRCKYFEVSRILINTERHREKVPYQSDKTSFRVLLCIDGCGTINFESDKIDFFKGDCIFVPSESVELRIHGVAQFLDVRG